MRVTQNLVDNFSQRATRLSAATAAVSKHIAGRLNLDPTGAFVFVSQSARAKLTQHTTTVA